MFVRSLYVALLLCSSIVVSAESPVSSQKSLLAFKPLKISSRYLLETKDKFHRSSKYLSLYFDHFMMQSSITHSAVDNINNTKSNVSIYSSPKILESFFNWIDTPKALAINFESKGLYRWQLDRSAMAPATNMQDYLVTIDENGNCRFNDGRTFDSLREIIAKKNSYYYQMFIIDIHGDMYIHPYYPGVAEHINFANYKSVWLSGLVKGFRGKLEKLILYSPQYPIPLTQRADAVRNVKFYIQSRKINVGRVTFGRAWLWPWEALWSMEGTMSNRQGINLST